MCWMKINQIINEEKFQWIYFSLNTPIQKGKNNPKDDDIRVLHSIDRLLKNIRLIETDLPMAWIFWNQGAEKNEMAVKNRAVCSIGE